MGQNRDMNDNVSDQVFHVGTAVTVQHLGGGVLHYQSVMISHDY
jgi:hypothetical protein